MALSGRVFVLSICIVSLFLLIIPIAYSSNVSVQYFHMYGCNDCEAADPIIHQVENNYKNVSFEWVDVGYAEGFDKWQKYGFKEVPAVVINDEIAIPKENISEKNLSMAIDNYLAGNKQESGFTSTVWSVQLAYSLGVFSGFSPCLMAMLGFILTYTAGTSKGAKDGMGRATIFGSGLLTAYFFIGLLVFLFKQSISAIYSLSIVACVITIIIGLSLVGLFKMPFTLDDFYKRSVKKYAGTWIGLFFLGILFSIVKVPCSAPLLLILISEMINGDSISYLITLIAFGAGVLTPFIGIGLIGGYAMSEKIRYYRKYIKTLSGVIIILFSVWIIIGYFGIS